MSADFAQITAAYDRFANAWQTNDPAAVASFFVEDGSLINPFGQRADGRDAIAALYAQFFGGMLRGTSTTFRLLSVRAVDDHHAFVDSEQTIRTPAGETLLVVHLAALLRREGDDWRFVDGRPYTYASAPS